jgi:hypothetical protein
MHYTINEIGDIATENPKHKGLTHFGKRVVEKMQEMGMVVDVAHAHSLTLKDIAAISSKPIMDSTPVLHLSATPPRTPKRRFAACGHGRKGSRWIHMSRFSGIHI